MGNIKKRDTIIDILKGIAVLAVLLGHSIQRGIPNDYLDNIIFKIIYSFHMPLFMVLSGYTLKKYTKNYNFAFLKKRFMRLIIPTIVWSYIIYFMRNFNFVGIKEFIFFPNSVIEYTKILILHPDYVIWFLYIVFICDCIAFIQNRYVSTNEVSQHIIISIIISLVLKILPGQQYFGIYRLQLFFPLFFLGYYLEVVEKWIKTIDIKSLLLIAIIYIILLFKFNPIVDNIPLYYLISIMAMMLIYKAVSLLKKEYFIRILTFFGSYSLEIYLCQCICLNIGISNGIIRVITIFISATVLSCLLSVATRKIKFLNSILY